MILISRGTKTGNETKEKTNVEVDNMKIKIRCRKANTGERQQYSMSPSLDVFVARLIHIS